MKAKYSAGDLLLSTGLKDAPVLDLVWPLHDLLRLREFLSPRCKDNDFWHGHEALTDAKFTQRHGSWRGAYEEGVLFLP